MNNPPYDVNQFNYPILELQPNSNSSPSFSNPSTQNSDYPQEIDNQTLTNLLLAYIKDNNPKDFRKELSSNSNILTQNSLDFIFKHILKLFISGEIKASRFLSILIPFGINPNITLNQINNKFDSKDNKEEYNKGESILMYFCSQSYSTIITSLCDSKISLNVNYLDIKKRNALFYLRGGNEDKKIIELLVERGINVNQRDIEGNTALHNAIINIGKNNLIYNLIDVANTNFMIKNNQNLNCLELINQKWITRKNINYNKYNTIDYKDIRQLIELIKNKLSIKIYGQSASFKNYSECRENSFDYNNLIKFPFVTFNKTIEGLNQKNEEDNFENIPIKTDDIDNNNIYLKLKNNPSLIIDTQFKDDKKISTSKKIEYYIQMNKNKKYFINLLKNSDNFLLEKTKNLKEEIELKKKKLEELKKTLNTTIEDLNNNKEKYKNDLAAKINEIIEIKKKSDSLKKIICKNESNIINIKPKENYLYKYGSMIIRDKINYDYIYRQLQIDLIDYMQCVHKKNSMLKNTILNVKQLLKDSVKKCLGDKYEVKIYGSRETGLCLPWSDIDAVISFTENEFQPLYKLYNYLNNNYKFVDIKYIENTQIPLIKIITTEEFFNISVDISLEMPEHHGAQCVNYIKEKIKEYEVLTPLTLALKTIFQKAKINDPYTGGLSSYGIILLIINFLKIKQKEEKDISIKNLGKLFYELLYFYGKKYNINDPIDVNENDKKKIEFIHCLNQNGNGLIIVDPLNIYNNVGRNMRQFVNIKFALSIAIASINESYECGCHYQHEGLCIKEEGCEHNLLNNIFKSIKRN
jgi:non-canonical poly(A) RNA polymerase PAPD5/7